MDTVVWVMVVAAAWCLIAVGTVLWLGRAIEHRETQRPVALPRRMRSRVGHRVSR